MSSAETDRTSSTADVMERFGVTQPTVSNWTRGGCPHSRDGEGRRAPLLFDLDEVSRWVKKERRTVVKASQSDDSGTSELDLLEVQHARAKYRKDLAAAERSELELDKARGKLVDTEEVKQGQLDRIARARAVLLGIPSSLAPDLVGEDLVEIERTLTDAIYGALTELSKDPDA